MATVLAFRTKKGAVSIPAGQTRQLGVVDVSPFSRIRVVADERVGSGTGVAIRLCISEGDEMVAYLDTLILKPHSQVSRVYEVPGTRLTIDADAIGGAGTDSIDLLVYGAE